MVKSSVGVISPEGEGILAGIGISAIVHKYHIAHDWACLKRSDANTFPSSIPLATEKSDMPGDTTLEKLFIYHCPVQLFLDDPEMERCHAMIKEASVGIVNVKTLNFQNGGFPGSCGGPYIFRNKAVALHIDSISTTKTIEDLRNESTTTKKGKKRKLTIAEKTTKVAESCSSFHTSLGTGISLHVRSGLMSLLNEEN